MSVGYYDEAVSDKISKWVIANDVKILKPDETTRLWEMTYDQKKDEPLTLPMIAISRDKQIEILNTQKQPKTFEGFIIKKNEKVSVPINVIPIKIGYQIDIYTRHLKEADVYLREFIFNLINYPKVIVDIPYNDANIQNECNISLDATITDNSDIKEHLFADQFTRFSIKFSIDDAYLFSIPVKTSATLEMGDLQVVDRYTGEVVEKSNIIS